MPYLIYCDLFHTDIIFAFICELLARTAWDSVAKGLVQSTERLKSDVIAGTKQ